MSAMRNTDPIRVQVAPGLILDLTPRCGQCGDREGMDTQARVDAGLCILCDPTGMIDCEGCGLDTPVRDLVEAQVVRGGRLVFRELCPSCR